MSNTPIVGRVNVSLFVDRTATRTTSDILPLVDMNASNPIKHKDFVSAATLNGVPNVSATISASPARRTINQLLYSRATVGSAYSKPSSFDAITDNIGSQTISTSVARTSGKLVTT